MYIKTTLPTTSNNESDFLDMNDCTDEQQLVSSDIMKLNNFKGLAIFLDDVEDEAVKHIEKICMLFGANLVVFRLICDLLLTDENYKIKNLNEVLFIFISMLNGATAVNNEEDESNKYSIIRHLLNVLIDTNEEIGQDVGIKPLTEQNFEIINSCLNLQLLESTSKCIKADKFKQIFLLDILYFILKHYQNENMLIKVFAYRCLDELSVNLGFKDVKNLLSINYDYIINSLYLNIVSTNSKKSYLLVLCSLINICDVDIVNYLQQIIQNLFSNLELRLYNDNLSYLNFFCYALVYLSKSIRKWYQIPSSREVSKKREKKASKTYKQLIDEINEEIDRHKAEFIKFHKVDEDAKEEEEDEPNLENENGEAAEKKLPIQITIQIKCLEICQHLISYPNKQICLLVIEIIKNFSFNLVSLGYKDELLPLLHKLWQPIIKQFCVDATSIDSRMSNSGVIYQINICLIKLLFNLINISDTFLIKRFNDDFLPILLEFMRKQSKISFNYKLRADTTYIYSNGFKLQTIILKYLPKIYCNSNEILIDELCLESLLKSLVIPYLDKRQPMQLQNLALDAIESFCCINSDIIWLYMHLILDFSFLKDELQTDVNYLKSISFKYSSLIVDNQIRSELLNIYQNL